MVINVSNEDIQWAQVHGAENPLVHVIQREAGGSWHISCNRVAYEMVWPYRNALLSDDVSEILEGYQSTGKVEPFQCELRLMYGQKFEAGAD